MKSEHKWLITSEPLSYSHVANKNCQSCYFTQLFCSKSSTINIAHLSAPN